MVEVNWRTVAERLERLVAGPDPEQQLIAEVVGTNFGSWPVIVCAHYLQRHLRVPLHLPPPMSPAERSVQYCLELAEETSTAIPDEHHDDNALLDAWIGAMYDKRAAAALRSLQPETGDIVERVAGTGPSPGEISSISLDGRLNFRGGFGRGVRPHNARILNRKHADAAAWSEGQAKAREAVARHHPAPHQIGTRARQELDHWQVVHGPGEAAHRAFEEALETAADEKPLQKVLGSFPELLSHLVDFTQGAWVIPQVKLGDTYVADFLVAAETSLGIRWLFVELESPIHRLRLKTKNAFSEGVRQGVMQINNWRDWIRDHQDMARRTRYENGLGLSGIRSDAKGLVLIGRGEITSDPDNVRIREADRSNIEVRTYDWLARAANRGRYAGFGQLSLEPDDQSTLLRGTW